MKILEENVYKTGPRFPDWIQIEYRELEKSV